MSRTAAPGDRKALGAWLLYDFANHAYAVTVFTLVWSVYFKTIVCADVPRWGDLLWGVSLALSMLITALATPILGAAADVGGWKRRYLTWLTLASALCCAALYFPGRGDIALGMTLFVVGTIGYQGAYTLYNAFLPEIAPPARQGRVSGQGAGVGYVGAIAILAVIAPLLKDGFAEENLPRLRLAFPASGLFFLVFAAPAFVWLRDRTASRAPVPVAELWRIGTGRLARTWRSIGRYKQVGSFLIAYFAYIDGVNTVLTFSTLYAKDTLGFTMIELTGLFLAIQTTAIVGALAIGWAVDRWGGKRAILATLVLWTVVVVSAMITESKTSFWAIGVLAGFAVGSCQTASRALMSRLAPEGQAAEFFSFYGVFGKVSAALGPLLFGLASGVFQTQRAGLGVVLAFFVLGAALLARVREDAPPEPKGA